MRKKYNKDDTLGGGVPTHGFAGYRQGSDSKFPIYTYCHATSLALSEIHWEKSLEKTK